MKAILILAGLSGIYGLALALYYLYYRRQLRLARDWPLLLLVGGLAFLGMAVFVTFLLWPPLDWRLTSTGLALIAVITWAVLREG